MSIRTALRGLSRILSLFAVGPFLGLLGWRMDRSLRSKDRMLAVLYGLAIVTSSAALALYGTGAVRAWLE